MTHIHRPLTEIGKSFTEVTKEYNGTKYSWLAVNEAAKKVAVLIHGVTGNKLDMVVLGNEYAKLGYAVYAPDLPGHGKAPVLDADSFDELGDWLKDCIAAIGRRPDLLVGNSFASAICYNFASQGYLASDTHLVLACPTPDIAWSSRALRRAGGALPNTVATKAYNAKLAIDARVSYLAQSKEPSSRKWLNESEYHKIPFIQAKVGNQMSSLLASHNPYLAPVLPGPVQKQITVIVGSKDNVITKKALPALRRILPEARLLIIPDVGHILHFEAPREIVDATA
jgi:pimeloyl-ACP methyl ester carboxylesterase